jgi:dTDP-4-amino-4,6-dideoxygalactose transaminase
LRDSPVRPLERLDDRNHVFHLFVVVAPDRDAFQAHLLDRGVRTLIHYPLPVHRQPAYEHLADGPVALTNAEQLCAQVVSLPIYPELRDAEVAQVVDAIRAFAA